MWHNSEAWRKKEKKKRERERAGYRAEKPEDINMAALSNGWSEVKIYMTNGARWLL